MSLQIMIALLAPLLLQIIGFACFGLVDPCINKPRKNAVLVIAVLLFALTLQNVMEYQLKFNGANPFLRTMVGIVGYSIRPLIVLLFSIFIDGESGLASYFGSLR